MADVIYKRGPLSNLPEHAADGEILVATLADNTKEAEMYIGFVDAKRKITDTSKQDRIGAVETSDIPDLGLLAKLKLDSAAINEISFDNQIYISGQGTYGVDAQNISEFAKTIIIDGNDSIDIASQGDSIHLGRNNGYNGLSLYSSTNEINVNNNRISNLVAPETDDQAANKEYVDKKPGKKTIEGGEIFNDYENGKATGEYSHAEGYYTEATGYCAHTEGCGTDATNGAAHAEGFKTKAYGAQSHTEGYMTKTGSIDEEGNLIADGGSAHAEGYETNALGTASHSEGITTVAQGNASHTEGTSTVASADSSHAEGFESQATMSYAHAEGKTTIASGESSHSEGQDTKATGYYAHAEGYTNVASGLASHAEGGQYEDGIAIGNTASGNASHAEGYGTTASGIASHAEGKNTQASGLYAHAEGNGTTADYSAHSEGQGTKATGMCAHAEGQNTIAEGQNSHAEGYDTQVTGWASHVSGNGTRAEYAEQFICGKYNNNKEDTLFEVGNGTYYNDRKNAFEVYKDGHVEIQAQGTTNNSVVTKKYVDNLSIAKYYDLYTEEPIEAPRMPLSLGYGTETDTIVIGAPNGIFLSQASAGSFNAYELEIGAGISMNQGALIALSENNPLVAHDQLKLVGGFSTEGGSPWDKGNALYIDKDKACFLNQANNAPIKVTGIATPTEANDAVNKAYVDNNSNQVKLTTYSELTQNDNTIAQISADELKLIGRTLAPQEKIYDIIYQGGSGQTTGIMYEFSHTKSNTIYYDWIDENNNSGFSYDSDTVIDIPAGTMFKLELDENYYTDTAERAQALERLAQGWGDDQHLKLVAYVSVKVPGGDMPINGVSKIVSDGFTLETHSSTIDLIGASYYEYDIELTGNASHDFTEGTTYGFYPDSSQNIGDKLWYGTGIIESGGFNFYVLNTEKNRNLPLLENVGMRGSFFTLSRPADSTGPAILKVKSHNTTGVGLSINANNLHFASIPSSYQYDINLMSSASHGFTEGVVSYIDEFENFEEELSVGVTLDDGTEAGVTLTIAYTTNNEYLPEISKILVPGTRIRLSRSSQSTGAATLSFTLEVPDDSIRLKNIATPIDATDAVNKAYVDALDNVLKDIRDAIRGGGTTEQTVAQIEQLITNYLETKTVAEVEE